MSEIVGGNAAPGLAPAQPRTGTGVRRGARRGFYAGLTLVFYAMVVAGFWPSYYGKLATGEGFRAHWVIHLHGAVFSGWMVLLAAQVAFAAMRRIDLHRRVGRFGIAYGLVVLALGTAVTFVAPALRVASGQWTRDQAAAFLVLPIGDMLLFGGFFAAAILRRRQPESHKRLMVLATVALMFAPAGRLCDDNLALFFAIWMAPMAIALAHDLWSLGRIHRTYRIGTAILLVAFLRVPAMESPWWLAIGRRIVDALASHPTS